MGAKSQSPERTTGTRKKRWFANLVALVGFLVAFEFVARGQSWSAPRYSSFLHYQHVFTPTFQTGTASDGGAVWITRDPRHPVQWIQKDKADNTLRVLCYGGSATAGLGYSPNVTFVRHLEILLKRAYPERNVEVINLGTVAIASKQVLEMVRDGVANYEPDLVIVYSGNNEFLEVHAKHFARERGDWKTKLRASLRKSALIRAFERAALGPPEPADLPDRRPGQSGHTQAEIIAEIEIAPEEREAAFHQYTENLVAAAQAAEESNVPIVICTVAVNWQWSGKEETAYEWQGTCEEPEMLARAAAILERLNEEDLTKKEAWTLQLERAELLASTGDQITASAEYAMALEMDPHQRRATIEQGLRLRKALQGTEARVFDTTGFLLSNSQFAWIGFDDFYDYVHFTPQGAAKLGEGLFFELLQSGLVPESDLAQARGYASAYQELLTRQAAKQAPDFLDPKYFLGIGLNLEHLESRDLWKYEAMALELEVAIQNKPDEFHAWAYRGNRRSFKQGMTTAALEDWRKALELGAPADIFETAVEALEERPKPTESKN